MNEQQQRMAAVETDKELSDLLDFSAVREWQSSLGGSGWRKSAIQRERERAAQIGGLKKVRPGRNI